MIRASMRKERLQSVLLTMGVVFVGVIAYAPLIGQLGFYRDDWYQLWAVDTFGPASVISLFSIDRPVMGYLYAGTSSMLGIRPLPWHLYALALRLAGALAFLGMMRSLWPRQRQAAFLATLLFLVYPGFQHQPNANTFSNHLYTYAMAMISLWLTAVSLNSPTPSGRRLTTIGAVLTAACYFPIYEYMVGLEALRLGILWLHERRRQPVGLRPSVQDLAKAWAPYGVTLAAFLLWRVFFFTSGRGATNVHVLASSYLADPRHAIARLVVEIPKDILEAALLGWFVPAYNALEAADYRQALCGAAWAALAAGLAAATTRLLGPRSDASQAGAGDEPWARAALWLGALGTFGTIAVVVVGGRDIRWDSGFDRYTLQTTAGLALLTVGFFGQHLRRRLCHSLPIFLVGLSVCTHYLNGVEWRDFWLNQQRFWWQMTWRAPRLVPGTVLITEVAGGAFREDYEIWGPANLIYDRGSPDPSIAAEILNKTTVDQVRLGERDVRGMRAIITLPKDFRHALVASMPTPASCVHVLHGASPEVPASASPLIALLAPFSHIDQIEADADSLSPLPEVFGPEPPRNWCYYCERADLARQRGDWAEAARLGDLARDAGLRPSDRSEWMPFLMAYVVTGREETAREVASLIRDEERLRHGLCDAADRAVFPDPETAALFDRLLCEFE